MYVMRLFIRSKEAESDAGIFNSPEEITLTLPYKMLIVFMYIINITDSLRSCCSLNIVDILTRITMACLFYYK